MISYLFALVSVLLISLGRASWVWYLSPLSALFGYACAWRATKRFFPLWALFSLANLIHFSWLLSHPFLYIVFVWLFCSIFLALPYASLSAKMIKTEITLSRSLYFASLFALLEWGWTLLGISFQTSAIHLSWHVAPLQIASLFGTLGLSFLVFWTNILWYTSSRLCIFVALFPYLVGGSLYLAKMTTPPSPSVKAAVCHMDEEPDAFADSLSPYEIQENKWKSILSLLSTLKPGDTDIVVLPEGITPFSATAELFPAAHFSPFQKTWHKPFLSSLDIAHVLAEQLKTPLLIGLEGQTRGLSYNSCFFISPDNIYTERYDKQLLLPLGEYIPWEFLRSYLASYGMHGSFTPGKQAKIFNAKNLKIAPLICYEETFSAYSEKALLLNPSCFVSLSNDAWFPNSLLADEHFELARIRAVEIGKPFIRATNKGISGGIDSVGKTICATKGRGCCLSFHVPIDSFITPFAHIGTSWMVVLLSCIALFFSPVFETRK